MYFECKYAGHKFFNRNLSKFHVGNVIVNDGKDTIPLYMGDWDLDGKYDLGFAVGYVQCVAPQPICPPVVVVQPQITCKPKPKKPCKPTVKVIVVEHEVHMPKVEVNTQTSCKPKVCMPLIQINLLSNVTNNVKIGGGCSK